MSVKITKAEITNVNIIAPLFDAYRSFYKQAPDVSAAAAFLQERLSKNESVIFIAWIDEEAVGFTQLYPIFSSVGMKPAWLLNDLYVSEKARKQGVAAALLDAAKDHGAATGAGWLMLQTGEDNRAAQSVYEKQGWVKEKDFFYTINVG